MTRSKLYYLHENHGVTALASEWVVDEREQRLKIIGSLRNQSDPKTWEMIDAAVQSLRLAESPIFTFCSVERHRRSPWFTGSATLHLPPIMRHIQANGGTIVQSRDFYVPFSNGIETGYGFSPAARKNEFRFVTTRQDFVDEFGMTLSDIIDKYL